MLFAILLVILSCSKEPEREKSPLIQLCGEELGTEWMVTVLTNHKFDQEDLRKEITQNLQASDKLFSHRRSDSELHRFNANLSVNPISIHPELFDLFRHAQWMHQQSEGAFDPTIAPIVNLWYFNPDRIPHSSIPTDRQIDETLEVTGIENLTLLSKGRVQKKIHRLQIDFSGSAKGEIVDQLCELLIRWNFDNFLVEIGGKVRAQGKGRRGEGWLISLKGGDSPLQSKVAVTLRNYAVASCYNFKQQSPVANPNTPHLMDPRTGRPIPNELMAVYSFAPTARDADAWATALMILGPVEGMKKADQMDMVVRFCLKKGNSSEFINSQAFQRLFLQEGRNP